MILNVGHRYLGERRWVDRASDRDKSREIGILSSLPPHPSIVEFKEAVVEDSGLVFVVMEYLPNDLKKLMDLKKSSNNPFTLREVKNMMKQLLEGIAFLHDNGVMHRDLKPSNILIDDSKGQLKICDFGLSRCCYGKASGSYTPGLVTLWYRAPELLLGAKEYSCAIDMWSVGCIMTELLLKQVLFKGTSELHQVGSIFTILGTPDDVSWPGFSSLLGSSIFQFAKQPYNDQLRLKFVVATDSSRAPLLTERGFDLLEKLLAYDPHKRISAKAALDHDWFREY
ncbi:hypothetical protein DH2020_039686 [Rehmannia glutinosa]|uniref:Protein kinase domain-containing protein n=1 Tax=Rehmannia glutinosa TaxID=99300 RepID=A0ABR0UV51_REHGL